MSSLSDFAFMKAFFPIGFVNTFYAHVWLVSRVSYFYVSIVFDSQGIVNSDSKLVSTRVVTIKGGCLRGFYSKCNLLAIDNLV